MPLPSEIARRRTFAIISHPDAGKTTITEKLLLFGGAVQTAGEVRARRTRRHTVSDFMEMERSRGISVSTSVMSFEYDGYAVNLLDTPGHEDFSEDTYRVLTAVDSALMVLDAAKGVEARTEALMDVCRLRDTPVMTFANKLDRYGLDPLDLLDDVEKKLGISCAPLTWPIGMGSELAGVYERLGCQVVLYEPARRGHRNERVVLDTIDDPRLDDRVGARAADALRGEIELLEGASDPFEPEAYLAGRQTPVFFGSAINSFGVQELLDCFVSQAPPPQPRQADTRLVSPREKGFTGFVFKIQANLDPAHRDRMAFVRVTSGHYRRGMKLRHVRAGRDLTINNATTFLSRNRTVTEEAYPGDIIGIHNHGALRVGDTLTEGEALSFRGIPMFAPKLFRRARLLDPVKAKALRKGLLQLSEEGAAQFFRPLDGNHYVLGALGPLQFDVIEARLRSEYNVRATFEPMDLHAARWVDADEPAELDAFIDRNRHRLFRDTAGNFVYIVQSAWAVGYAVENNPRVRFSETREACAELSR